jgi:hypothetical protein
MPPMSLIYMPASRHPVSVLHPKDMLLLTNQWILDTSTPRLKGVASTVFIDFSFFGVLELLPHSYSYTNFFSNKHRRCRPENKIHHAKFCPSTYSKTHGNVLKSSAGSPILNFMMAN